MKPAIVFLFNEHRLRAMVATITAVAVLSPPTNRLHAQSEWAFAGLSIPSSLTTLTTDKGSVSWIRRGTFAGYDGGTLAYNQRLNGANFVGAGDYFIDGATRFAAARAYFIFDVSSLAGSSWAQLSVTQGGVQGAETVGFRVLSNPFGFSGIGSFGYAISDVMWGSLGTGSLVGTFTFDAPTGASSALPITIDLGEAAVSGINAAAAGGDGGWFGVGAALGADVPVSSVPEPSTTVLLATGLAVLLLTTRRRAGR
jgi:hypothetical protein